MIDNGRHDMNLASPRIYYGRNQGILISFSKRIPIVILFLILMGDELLSFRKRGNWMKLFHKKFQNFDVVSEVGSAGYHVAS